MEQFIAIILKIKGDKRRSYFTYVKTIIIPSAHFKMAV